VAFLARLRMLRPGSLASLRWSLFCGEALPRRIVEAWAAAAPNSRIENLYGPTEATIAITAFRLPDDLRALPEVVPIGLPLDGQRAAVMGDDSEGELWLSGTQVADGYWRQPGLTDERFVTKGNRRWYRTGDRAVFGTHGWEYRGRLDRQVKVSGHRVELLEVETALRAAAECDSVAALPWPVDSDGLAHGIVAVVAAESRPDQWIEAVCRRTLAPYMMPSRVLRVSEWPLNSNGKTDYRALVQTLEADAS